MTSWAARKPRAKSHIFTYTGTMLCGECGSAITACTKTKLVKTKNELKDYGIKSNVLYDIRTVSGGPPPTKFTLDEKLEKEQKNSIKVNIKNFIYIFSFYLFNISAYKNAGIIYQNINFFYFA